MAHLAIDGNEANVANRVGSNVYAYELLTALEKLIGKKKGLEVTVLLRSQPLHDMPPVRDGWSYQVLTPGKFWTQWALPLHLFNHRNKYDLHFSPGHYAPHSSPIPFVCTVMDTAYLDYPNHFRSADLFQLKIWTKLAVSKAAKIIAISEATKDDVIRHYHRQPDDVVVAYPAFELKRKNLVGQEAKDFLESKKITEPYLLFVGTIQPRKNIIALVEAFEIFTRMAASRTLKQKRSGRKRAKTQAAKLVLAGKTGWLSGETLERIDNSPLKNRIVITGFVTEAQKQLLYKNAFASALVGLHEGFGIPPLESMALGTPVLVSNTTSLPEVVGDAGFMANPLDPQDIAEKIWEVYTLSAKEKALSRKRGKEQAANFSWEESAKTILNTLEELIEKQ